MVLAQVAHVRAVQLASGRLGRAQGTASSMAHPQGHWQEASAPSVWTPHGAAWASSQHGGGPPSVSHLRESEVEAIISFLASLGGHAWSFLSYV